MKKSIILTSCIFLGFIFNLNAQVGINIATPTEMYDVNGTTRVRSLPSIGTANSIYTTGTNTNSGTTPTQTFNGTTLVYSDNNGVLGKSASTTSNLIPNNSATGFNTTNTSTAMFVIKRFTITDWPSNGGGVSTGMDVANWEAIMSNIQFNIPQDATATALFTGGEHSYRLKGTTNDVWRIIGDLNGISDGSTIVDILFIKKTFTTGDPRTN